MGYSHSNPCLTKCFGFSCSTVFDLAIMSGYASNDFLPMKVNKSVTTFCEKQGHFLAIIIRWGAVAQSVERPSKVPV